MKPSLSTLPLRSARWPGVAGLLRNQGQRGRWLGGLLGLALVGGCAAVGTSSDPATALQSATRLTWGASVPAVAALSRSSAQAWLDAQLRPSSAPPTLPGPVQAQINAMTISQRPVAELVADMVQQRQAANALPDDAAKQAARNAWQQEMNRLAREAAQRHLLRAVYSPRQVQEQMTWFWLNHFSVFQGKGEIRAMLGDYEDSAIRPHALGRFRDLLGAVVRHPAMLQFLDNAQNASGRLNENYARELMELHTLGVDAGYTQRDVQELARVLTGVGVQTKLGGDQPRLPAAQQALYVRQGLFEFNPRRHDFGPKVFLGQPVPGQGLAEVDQALDRLARAPATARFISGKLAHYWLSDDAPRALVDRMAQTFQRSDGDIAATLRTLFTSNEFQRGAGGKFKDPMRYVVSALRLSYGDTPILNTAPALGWLNRLGEPLYGRQTPDGYPLNDSAWSSSGQMETRFELARAIGAARPDLRQAVEPPVPGSPAAAPTPPAAPLPAPDGAHALYGQPPGADALGARTRQALGQAKSPAEWNALLLSSPEFMRR
ncbi:DUF1800 domain-containing protein [Ottowia oryzae]|uniref:DUF1800 domain-containing protein n=1 Tax=Ottowia oryzae TaxID=2109914 RepID=UPI001B7FFEB3|nr:DUF1800 domain-containing protein [Ottowia oryzae]